MDAANFRYRHARGMIYGYISEDGLQALRLPITGKPLTPHLLHSAPNSVRGRLLTQLLDAYFSGVRETFNDIPLDLGKGTPFQRRVWRLTRKIPWGHTACYGDIARQLGQPGAARAVAQALHANPVAILIPCHRVIQASGAMGGFAAGVKWKACLLRLEGFSEER